MKKKQWIHKIAPEEEIIQKLQSEIGVDHIIAHLLGQRTIESYDKAKTFFRPKLDQLHEPILMKDMEQAVNRILRAIEQKEGILVYGDYDVDGTTAVAITCLFLKKFHPTVEYYIPDRHEEGYGISFKGVDFATSKGISLIIALDCGIKAFSEIVYAKEKGIDFIICDHHFPEENIPEAFAILDPKRRDCNYPFKELSGCGISFKLIQALAQALGLSQEHVYKYLDLVAVSIVADIVPIIGENRILTYYGLQKLNRDPSKGLYALTKEMIGPISVSNIVFQIAPKINAAGRIDHAKQSVELLLSDTEKQIDQFAAQISDLNVSRKDLDQQTTQEALDLIEAQQEQEHYSTVVYQPHWNKGILGIVASRLIETYYRPTLVFTKSQRKLVASARSIEEFDLYKTLETCAIYIEQFGGHKYAAGLTLDPKKFTDFKTHFEKTVRDTIDETQRLTRIKIDHEISLPEITPKFLRILKQFEPFGPQNMRPVFLSRKIFDNGFGTKVGKDQSHLRLNVYQEKGSKTFIAIGFGMGKLLNLAKNGPFDIVYTIKEHYWEGNTFIQFCLKDLRRHDPRR
ncbi:MAG: single-stranded-DNA-specific exonuclease RecJ [Flavobacteriales bacterium AspAUS03]